jgi:hypothetical protein
LVAYHPGAHARMASDQSIQHAASTVGFEAFWTWLNASNCILAPAPPRRSSTTTTPLALRRRGPDTLVVQCVHSKLVRRSWWRPPAWRPGWRAKKTDVFELISEASDRVVSYRFVLSHGYDAQSPVSAGRAVH